MRWLVVALCVTGLTACTVHRESQKGGSKSLSAKADQDKDGIADANDMCPGQPETLNGYRDADGCPDEIPSKPAFRTIHYDVNSKGMPDESKEILAEVAGALQKFPALKIRVESHTDSYGAESYNLELSKRRANAVKQWLVKQHGIDAGRVDAAGYGMSRPVASLSTKEGRLANRRTQFVITEGWPPKE